MPVPRRSFRHVVLPAFIIVGGLITTAPQVVANPLFAAPFISADVGSYPYIQGPWSVAIGDLNGDGVPDLVTADVSSYIVSVALGNGNGTFRNQAYYYPGSVPRSVAIADMNGDGKPDLVTAGTNNVSVLLGNGDGTFGASINTDISPGYAYSVAIADLNGDGKLDAVTANAGTHNVSVLLGKGDGTFAAHADFPTGTGPEWVAIGDVSGDGKADVVTANHDANTVSVLFGDGHGSLVFDHDYATGTNPQSVAIADIDGDGWPDLATANNGSNNVTILAGSGFGSFGVRSDFATAVSPTSVAIRELNGDGGPDLIVSCGQSGAVSVLLRHTDGSYPVHNEFSVGGSPNSVAVGDMNGDGRLDIVTANSYNAPGVSLLLGNGDGTFGSPPRDVGSGWQNSSVAIGDFNHDGKPDLVFANGSYSPYGVGVMLGNGDGTFGIQHNYDIASFAFSVAIGDFNGDGNPDVVAANYNTSSVSVLLGDGFGNFFPHQEYDTGPGSIYLAIGDLNGDHKLDIVTAGSAYDKVSVLMGRGDGTFDPHMEYPVSVYSNRYPNAVAIGDVNGDGKPDLVTANLVSGSNGSSASISVLLGHGDGTFDALPDFGAVTYQFVAIGDLNGDGKADLVSYGSINGTYTPALMVLLGNGDGTFGAGTGFAVGGAPSAVAIGDVNGDGKPDLVSANGLAGNANNLSVLLGTNTGVFGLRMDYGAGGPPNPYFPNPYGIALGDLNGDGRLDVVTANNGSRGAQAVSVLLNTGAIASVDPSAKLHEPISLAAPRPNPFRGSEVLEFALPSTALVRLEIYDVQGRRVSTIQNGVLPAGRYTRSWDGTTTSGRVAQPGLYFVELSAGGVELTRKTVLTR